jgi:hypothetical protein
MGSMNGEIRIWDVRAPEKPLYEKLAQSNGLAGLAVHSGAPVFATYVSCLFSCSVLTTQYIGPIIPFITPTTRDPRFL